MRKITCTRVAFITVGVGKEIWGAKVYNFDNGAFFCELVLSFVVYFVGS